MINYNGIYMDYIGELRPESVKNAAEKIEKLASKYNSGNNKISYGVIPSKSFFINENLSNPFDYEQMDELLKENIKSANYVNLYDTVALGDYYLTDPHIKQDRLYKMVEKLAGVSNKGEDKLVGIEGFTGQHKANVADILPESVSYVKNDAIDSAIVTNVMGDPCTTVYNPEKLLTASPYDFFLSGPAPVKKIVNNKVSSEKRLVIFGDSFSCSIAPLLINQYYEIDIVDLRYVVSTLIENYVSITENTDILFLYNEQVINNGEMLKVI